VAAASSSNLTADAFATGDRGLTTADSDRAVHSARSARAPHVGARGRTADPAVDHGRRATAAADRRAHAPRFVGWCSRTARTLRRPPRSG
jgi:hypothetical protein